MCVTNATGPSRKGVPRVQWLHSGCAVAAQVMAEGPLFSLNLVLKIVDIIGQDHLCSQAPTDKKAKYVVRESPKCGAH
jgi:hypothetical protein